MPNQRALFTGGLNNTATRHSATTPTHAQMNRCDSVVVDAHRAPQHRCQTERRPHYPFDQEPIGLLVFLHRHDGRCAPHHDDAEADQSQGWRGKNSIRFEFSAIPVAARSS